ncbi:hypothetical protein [Fulvivirga ligni]|uniref:hypothetical protein n=1 Tax=Fulvivirga ligni TaxID=2904246 RepID=UPI001F1AD784|nr:hypothetical protein [Fulvivirga ligni]UII22703.1 hypothetical protein LVD16_05620 [Fulvivirga ligni]
MIYNKADFNNHISTLQIEGFKLKSAVQAYLFVRKEQYRTETITLSYKDYAPHGFYLTSVSADIYFNEVEDKLNILLDKHRIDQRYGNTTIQKSFQTLNGIDYKVLDTEINDEYSYRTVMSVVEKIVLNGVLPFFERYKELKKVNEDVARMSEDETSNFVSGIIGIKIPLIKKLVHSTDYLVELQQRKEFYSDEVFKYPQYFKDHDKVFNDLFSEDLEKI